MAKGLEDQSDNFLGHFKEKITSNWVQILTKQTNIREVIFAYWFNFINKATKKLNSLH